MMARRRNPRRFTRAADSPRSGDAPDRASKDRAERDSFLETVESLAVAIILAVVFRAYVVEAFMIPTGSMAPQLHGEHFEATCANCGYEYSVNRSAATAVGIEWQCPNCRHHLVNDPDHPFYFGDRLLVMKFYYHFYDPERWDVLVFKNPQKPQENYIKRLIGLPNEQIEIIGGDVYINDRIARKPDHAQQALWLHVNDTDYWDDINGPHWQPVLGEDAALWSYHGMPIRLQPPPGDDRTHWLEYQHFGPAGRQVPIRDFYAYDNPTGGTPRQDGLSLVPDLRIIADATFDPVDAGGTVELEFKSFADTFRILLPVGQSADRSAVILHNGNVLLRQDVEPLPVGTPLAIEAANVDHKIVVKVDGQRIFRAHGGQAFAADRYGDPVYTPAQPRDQWLRLSASDSADATALRIGFSGLLATVSRLQVDRDIYYTETMVVDPKTHQRREMYAAEDRPYALGEDQFFVLGDNSPRSADSRMWRDSPVVDREDLVGKALFVYWPAAGFRYGIPLPIVPDAEAFRFVR